jgi:hypothetical protein
MFGVVEQSTSDSENGGMLLQSNLITRQVMSAEASRLFDQAKEQSAVIEKLLKEALIEKEKILADEVKSPEEKAPDALERRMSSVR